MSCNFNHILEIVLQYLEINQISALNNPLGVDMSLSKWTKKISYNLVQNGNEHT